ncbi:MAG: FCD domain-containing protein [Novosphingobium sp.]|nr:FCD domain-containing protein [Novosphingobium sp.]
MAGTQGKTAKGKASSAVSQAAATLRSYAMSVEEGQLLGSEEELCERLGVSRPTLRQAAAQVAQENLIAIRRGVGGGYFARVPDSMTVSRIAAIYLQSRDAGLEEIINAMKPIRIEIAALATRNRDPDMLEELRAFLAAEEDYVKGGDHGYRAFLRSEREFGKVIGRMSGNTVLTLFLNILYDFTALLRRDEDVPVNRPERVEAYRELRSRMARAILEGDEEIAIVATRRCSEIISDWMREDFGGRRFGSAIAEGFGAAGGGKDPQPAD